MKALALNVCNVIPRNCEVCCSGKYVPHNCSYVCFMTFNTSVDCMIRIRDLYATPETVAEGNVKEADEYCFYDQFTTRRICHFFNSTF